jgi:hypothetical protein
MYSTASPARGQITGPPYITLVDLDGFPIGVGEKNVPEPMPPDPTDQADWPADTDNWHWETDELVDEDLALAAAFDVAMERFEELHPVPAVLPVSFAAPEAWPLPISGGAPDDRPEFIPTAEDWADYRRHFDAAECPYGYE